MRIFDQLKNTSSFTQTERTIAEYILNHTDEVMSISLDELSRRLFVSKSTVIRFCKKLGFRGHKELTVALAQEMDRFLYREEMIDPSNPYAESDEKADLAGKTYSLIQAAITETWQDLDLNEMNSLASAIHNSHCILYASDDTYYAAMNFVWRLSFLGIHVGIARMPGENVQLIIKQKKGETALFVSYDASEPWLVRYAEYLKNNGVSIFLVTGPGKGPLNRVMDHVIRIAYYEPEPKQVNCGTHSAFLLIFDILYALLFAMDFKENNEAAHTRSRLMQNMNKKAA